MGLGKKSILIIIAIALLIVSGCQSSRGANPSTTDSIRQAKVQEDYWPSDEWRASTPEEQGMDSGKLADMIEDIDNFYGIRSVLVIRNGYLVLEGYRAPYDKDMTMNVKSVSKSVLSALVGIAIREKHIENIDQKVEEYLPEYFQDADPRKKEITLKHLLTMTTGLPTIETDTNWENSRDWVKYQLDLPLESNPGNNFGYSTGLTHIMSAILTKTSGVSTLELANNYLFEPMGIKVGRWVQDPNGIYFGGAELELTPRDMAKFGYLYLRNGVWNGQQLVPREWVESSVKNRVKATRFGDNVNEYGYWWWLGKDYYLAQGWGGQNIIVNPNLDMVVVFTSIDQKGPFDLYNNEILKAVKADEPIKPNPSAVDRLKANLDKLANPADEYTEPDAALIERINGRTFKAKQNMSGIESFSLYFKDSGCTFKYKQKDGEGREFTTEFPVGLNDAYQMSETEAPAFYYGYNRPFFPVNVPGGADKYPVSFKGYWSDKSSFTLKCLSPLGDPLNLLAVFQFKGNEVNVRLSAIPSGYHSSFDGVMEE